MKILSPKAHGVVDYLVVLAFLAAPRLIGFDEKVTTIAYAIAGVHLVLTLATAFPLGLVKVIPFALHGLIEFGVAIGLVALPWILGFSGDLNARNFFVGAGASVFVVFLITDYLAAARR